jgi:hypothetical protein
MTVFLLSCIPHFELDTFVLGTTRSGDRRPIGSGDLRKLTNRVMAGENQNASMNALSAPIF